MENLTLDRKTTSEKGTMGELLRAGARIAYTCELPWKNNATGKSCIPYGTYNVTRRQSPKYGDHFHVLDVPGREMILIHTGNTITDIRGCILIGMVTGELNGLPAVLQSRAAMKRLLDDLPGNFTLTITGVCG